MVVKTISPGCGVRASLMLFFETGSPVYFKMSYNYKLGASIYNIFLIPLFDTLKFSTTVVTIKLNTRLTGVHSQQNFCKIYSLKHAKDAEL